MGFTLSLVLFSVFQLAPGEVAPESSLDAEIYYLVGGPINRQAPPIRNALSDLQDFFESEIEHYSFEIFHNFEWEDLCEALKADSSEAPLIFIGQSWGAQATMDIARCLEGQRKIQLAILVDLIIKPWRENLGVLSYNVEEAWLWYQREDYFLQGSECVVREDGSYDGIECAYQESSTVFRAHDQIFHDLTQAYVIQDIILDTVY